MQPKTQSLADSIASWTLLATIALLPVFSMPFLGIYAETSKGFLLAIGVLLAFSSWLVARLLEGKLSVPMSWILAAAGLVAVSMSAAALFSGHIRASFWGSGFEVGTAGMAIIFAVLLFLCSLYFQDRKKITMLGMALASGFALACLFQIAHFFFGFSDVFGGVLSAPTANLIGKWNDFGIFSGLLALVSLCLLQYGSLPKRMRICTSVLLGLALFFMLLVNFLAAWVVFGVLALMIALYAYIPRKQLGKGTERAAQRALPMLPLALVVVSACFIFANGFVGDFLPAHLNTLTLEVRPSFGTTMAITGRSLMHDPVFGIGPNTFQSAWALYRSNGVLMSQFWNTDFSAGFGLLLTFFVNAGLLGGFAWLLLLASIVYQAFSSRMLALKDDMRDFTFGIFILTLYLWLMLLIYVPNVTLVGLAFAAAGIFIATLAGKKIVTIWTLSFARDHKHNLGGALAGIVMLLAVLGFGYVASRQVAAAWHYGQSNKALAAGLLDDAGRHLSRAIEIRPNDTYYRAITGLYLEKSAALLAERDVSPETLKPEIQKFIGAAEQSATMAIAYDETNYLNWMELADLYQSVLPLGFPDAYGRAKASYEKALAVSPNNPSIYLAIANLELANKNPEAAKAAALQALELKPDYTDGLFLLARIAREQGDLSGAVAFVERAAASDPSSFAAHFNLGILRYGADDFAGAIVPLERAVLLDPANLDAHYFLGRSYLAVGREGDALAQFHAIDTASPGNADIRKLIDSLEKGSSGTEE